MKRKNKFNLIKKLFLFICLFTLIIIIQLYIVEDTSIPTPKVKCCFSLMISFSSSSLLSSIFKNEKNIYVHF